MKFLSNRRLSVVLHILAWAIIVIIPRYLINTFGDGNQQFLNHLYINLTIYGSLFYVNYLWLVPNFFLKDKKLRYFLFAFVGVLAVCLIMWFVNEKLFFDPERARQFEEIMKELDKNEEVMKPPLKQFRILNYIYTSILVLGFSFGLRLLVKVNDDEKIRKELEREKLNSELAFLKNQISPHFFFNTLNNIYSLIAIDSTEAQGAVLKLSKLMRYLLYESEVGKTKLSEEISFINHYIDLMKLRLSKKVELDIQMPVEYPDLQLPPLVFITFVENAFKHGISYRDHSFIKIRMHIDQKLITFTTVNSIGSSSSENDGQQSGIGLENVKKRLNLLFPGKHKLNIEEDDQQFRVCLQLDLN